MNEMVVYLINNVGYNLMIDNNIIKDNITKHSQYANLSRAYEFRVGKLIIIRNRNLIIDHILLTRIRREVSRKYFFLEQLEYQFC